MYSGDQSLLYLPLCIIYHLSELHDFHQVLSTFCVLHGFEEIWAYISIL